ncbi:MAG: branched-chain amino acid ABC transporter permease [Eggerthella sp. 51_9]|nr:MAG: branched-chain amino acid ABC transporter permease [Eggerthella sp. 51_9]
MIGYVFLGIPCGILAQQIGLDPLQVFLLSMLFYSGAGQYMIPNMWLAGSPALAIIASVTLVNTRQLLYGASLSRFCHETPKPLSFLFGATVTDESFAVNLGRFSSGEWKVSQATAVNLLCETTWALANTLGVVLGSLLTVPTALASFAMTSIFLCLLFSQKATKPNIVAALIAVLGVFVCKCVGLSGPAILIGALAGVAAGMIVSRRGGAHVVE